jgi:hypothetical protein
LTNGKVPTWDLGKYNFKLHPVMIGVLGHLVLLCVGYVASLFFAPPEKSYRAMTLWGWLETRKLNELNPLHELHEVKGVTQLETPAVQGGEA